MVRYGIQQETEIIICMFGVGFPCCQEDKTGHIVLELVQKVSRRDRAKNIGRERIEKVVERLLVSKPKILV